MGEHDTKELADLKMTIFKYFNPSIFYKAKKSEIFNKIYVGLFRYLVVESLNTRTPRDMILFPKWLMLAKIFCVPW